MLRFPGHLRVCSAETDKFHKTETTSGPQFQASAPEGMPLASKEFSDLAVNNSYHLPDPVYHFENALLYIFNANYSGQNDFLCLPLPLHPLLLLFWFQ